jgi:hypothetical protein
MRVLRLERQEFLDHYWHYKPGEHVAAFGPTQRAGKTHLLFQLAQATVRPNLPAVAFCMKPVDRTVARWSKTLGFKEVPDWPPVQAPWQKPPGYTLWPRHTMDPAVDNPHLREVFRRGMLDGYKRGNRILFLDEIFGIIGELGLTEELLAILTRGGGGGCGGWLATQKPSGTQQVSMPGFVFNCPTHFFLAPDNDSRNRRRYAELGGGADPELIEYLTRYGLKKYEFLYLNADGEMVVIGP